MPNPIMSPTASGEAAGTIYDWQSRHLFKRLGFHPDVLLKGVQPEHFRILEAVGSLDHLATEHHVFADLPSAVAHARVMTSLGSESCAVCHGEHRDDAVSAKHRLQ